VHGHATLGGVTDAGNLTRDVSASYVMRWPWAAAASAVMVLPILVFLALLGLVLGDGWYAVAIGAAAAMLIAVRTARRARATVRLTLTPEGIHSRRHRHNVTARWDDVQGVRRRRVFGVPTEELVVRDSQLEITGALPGPTLKRLYATDVTRRVDISHYDRRWKQGPAGAALRERGLL
jgi:hypothetical protein